jgi:hypothetical protein
MARFGASPLSISAALAAIALHAEPGLHPAAAAASASELASHRAVYELKLAYSRGMSPAVAARGRILYDFSGNACDGYALQLRQVSELDDGEGRVTLSDLRTTTWEDGAARRFVYRSQSYRDQALVDTVEGEAEREPDRVAVNLSKPAGKMFNLESVTSFPTDHMRRILEAARAGQALLQLPVYDGSDKGEKVYNTLSVIGRPIAPGDREPTDAAAGQHALAGLKRWPVTVSYFDKAAAGGDATPIYSIKFEVYENGISRALVLDYNDFAISGELTALDIRESKPCR